jgi:SAM-dependent methyltransferase
MTNITPLEPLAVCRSYEDYRQLAKTKPGKKLREIEARLASAADEFKVPGFCAICEREVEFLVDRKYATTPLPNWRERLVCPRCDLNNRLRLSLHFVRQFCDVSESSHIYVTEQTSKLYSQMRKTYRNLVGSEYLRDGTARGAVNRDGLRHEDMTALSFADSSHDLICTFDVLEHVPDYRKGIMEAVRCLKSGGRMLMTAPFNLNSESTQLRARLLQDGSVEHLMPPLYHDDPLSPAGVLCYQTFGWDVLELMAQLGVSTALYFFWSDRLGYLGGLQFVIFGRKV